MYQMCWIRRKYVTHFLKKPIYGSITIKINVEDDVHVTAIMIF